MKTDLSVKIGKLKLKTPFICASGTFGYGAEMKGLADFKSIGAYVTKTITVQPRVGNPPPRIMEVETGVLNSIGIENPGLDVFIREKLPGIKKITTPFLVSVGGHDKEEFKELVARLDKVRAVKAIELNLSCPNLRLKKLISQSPALTGTLVKEARALTKKTLVVKVTGETEDISRITRIVSDAGADALSLVNTFFGMAINIDTGRPYLGNIYGGYSGKGIKPLSLYRVWKAAQSADLPLIGGGGVSRAEDAVEFLLAGATAVSVGTVLFTDPDATKIMAQGLRLYMKKHGLKSINQITGKIKTSG